MASSMAHHSSSSAGDSTNVEGKLVRAGAVVMEANPWIAVVSWTKRSEVCAFCWKNKAGLKACNGCHFCYYCDKRCQTSDWGKEHKYECKMLEAVEEFFTETESFDLEFKEMESQFRCALYILLVKALNRYAVKYPKYHPDIDEEAARKYFKSLIPKHGRGDTGMVGRIDKEGLPGLTGFRDFVSEDAKFSLRKVLSDKQCLVLAQNIMTASEWIDYSLRSAASSAYGVGVYMDMHTTGVTCKGNSEWSYSGSKIVMKALVDIPDFRGRGQITISPAYIRSEMVTRVERRSYYRFLASTAGVEYKDCSCDRCTDEAEAEVNPIKCVTLSCMESIPSDERAHLPCAQCGAMNGDRLAVARAQLEEFNAKVLQITDSAERANRSVQKVYWWGKRASMLQEMDETRVVLHPNNYMRLRLLEKTVRTMVLEEMCKNKIRPGLGIKYCEELLKARAVYRDYFYEVSPHYGMLLHSCGTFGILHYGQLRDGHRSAKRRYEESQVSQKMDRYVTLLKEGREIVTEFTEKPFLEGDAPVFKP